MQAASEGEKKKPPKGGGNGVGENKSKRKMKTTSQLELLEKTFAGSFDFFFLLYFCFFDFMFLIDLN